MLCVLFPPPLYAEELPQYPRVTVGALRHALDPALADQTTKIDLGEPFLIIGTVIQPSKSSFILREYSVACCTGYTMACRVTGASGAFKEGARIAVYGRLVDGEDMAAPDHKLANLWLEEKAIKPELIVSAERLIKRDNIIEALDMDSLRIFNRALKETGIAEYLRTEQAVTVLAPIDQAFENMGEEKLASLFKPENRKLLRGLVLRHLIPGTLSDRDLMNVTSVQSLTRERFPVKVDGGKVQIGNARLLWKNVRGSNGMAHVIHKIFMPKDAIREWSTERRKSPPTVESKIDAL